MRLRMIKWHRPIYQGKYCFKSQDTFLCLPFQKHPPFSKATIYLLFSIVPYHPYLQISLFVVTYRYLTYLFRSSLQIPLVSYLYLFLVLYISFNDQATGRYLSLVIVILSLPIVSHRYLSLPIISYCYFRSDQLTSNLNLIPVDCG